LAQLRAFGDVIHCTGTAFCYRCARLAPRVQHSVRSPTYAGRVARFGLRRFFRRAVRKGRPGRHRRLSRPRNMSDSAVVDDVQAPGRHLAPEEVLEKLDSLSADDKLRLRLLERRRLGGTDLQEGELYHE